MITQASIREQIPGQTMQNVQISGDGKEVAGVIDERLQTEGDVLANQAIMMARARNGGIAYEAGADLPADFIKRIQGNNLPAQYFGRSMSQETIDALTVGSQQRDQQWIGNNADWTGYYLEPLAKYIIPFDTPFRNMLPRTPSVGIDVENWRAITSVFNGNGPSVGNFILPQGPTPGPNVAQYVWANKSNILRQLAWSDIVTFETELFGRMFEPDVRAKVAAKLAPSLMLGQETWYLNAGQNLWSPNPSNGFSTSTSGGTLTAATYWFIVTAVNIASGGGSAGTGETLGYGGVTGATTPTVIPSITTTGSTSTITFNIQRVPNAFQYNVYVGTGSTQPAMSAMALQASGNFSGTNPLVDPGGLAQGWIQVTMTAFSSSGTKYNTLTSNTATAFSSTNTPGSTFPLTFDGIQSLVYLNSGTLSTVGEHGETPVVAQVNDSGGALAKSDLDKALENMYYNARANPEAMLVSIKDHKAISNIVAQNTAFRIQTQPTQAGLSDLVGGARATKWVNQTTGRLMDIIMCPYLMQGTIVFVSLTLPFQVAEIDKPPLRVSVNREMWAVEYPPDQSHKTQWAYGAYSSETLVSQYLGGQGVLAGIIQS